MRDATALFLLAASGLFVGSGCGEERTRFRVRVDTTAEVPAQISRVVVSWLASRTGVSRPQTCVPATREFDMSVQPMPFYVEFLPGTEFNSFVALRVQFYSPGGELVGQRGFMKDTLEPGMSEYSASIDEACIVGAGVFLCDPAAGREQCEGEGACRPLGGYDLWNHPEYIVDGGPPCDPQDDAADVGVDADAAADAATDGP